MVQRVELAEGGKGRVVMGGRCWVFVCCTCLRACGQYEQMLEAL